MHILYIGSEETSSHPRLQSGSPARPLKPNYLTYLLGGPLTPAPITLGRSSSPIEYKFPTAHETRLTSTTEKPASSQNGTTTSFFWHAGPPYRVVLTVPSGFVLTRARHAHDQHCFPPWVFTSLFVYARLHVPWPVQFRVAVSHAVRDRWQDGRIPRRGLD